MLLESGNFEKGKSIVSTPPTIRDTLTISLRSEFEPIRSISNVVVSVITIINDIPFTNSDASLGGDAYIGSDAPITIAWECIPPTEVTLKLYGAQLDEYYSADNILGIIEDYRVRETITTSNTTHTFDITPYIYGTVQPSFGTSMYIAITPSNGISVEGRTVSIVGTPPPPRVIPSVVTIINDIPVDNQGLSFEYDTLIGNYTSMTITWDCTPPTEVTLELYGANLVSNDQFFQGVPFGTVESFRVRETITTSNTTHTFDITPYLFREEYFGTSMYIVITPSNGLPVQGHTIYVIGQLPFS